MRYTDAMLLKLQKYTLKSQVHWGQGHACCRCTLTSLLKIDVIEDHDSEEMEVAVHTLTANLPISDSRKAEFRSATKSYMSLLHVKKLTNEGWPTNLSNVPEPARPFWKIRDEFAHY